MGLADLGVDVPLPVHAEQAEFAIAAHCRTLRGADHVRGGATAVAVARAHGGGRHTGGTHRGDERGGQERVVAMYGDAGGGRGIVEAETPVPAIVDLNIDLGVIGKVEARAAESVLALLLRE